MNIPPQSTPSLTVRLALGASLAWLWFQLINHLRIEWSVNAQYAYGSAVPFLGLYLLWKRLKTTSDVAPKSVVIRHLPSSIFHLLWIIAALLYLPTRLIEEANPDWRLISWALAVEVIIITLCLAPYLLSSNAKLLVRPSSFVFPLGFFLVAVPWPTRLESILIQSLTRANAGATIELLNGFGIPALARGNVIEISTGLVGIDDACSGIRSVQATLMIALFLGALYRLSAARRLGLIISGFALAFIFNVARTLLLVSIAAKQGVPAISKWHDPAGVTILVACFLGLWLLGVWLARSPKSEVQSLKLNTNVTSAARSISQLPASSFDLRSPLFLLTWLLAVEIGVAAWYRSHERQLTPAIDWQLAVTNSDVESKELPISENAQRILRYDSGRNVAWTETNGSRWQMIYLRWNGGRIAAHLARNHTPEVCLTAAGHELTSVSEAKLLTVHGVVFPFRRYAFQNGTPSLFVFYCLREDRDHDEVFTTESLTVASRLAAVRAGRRNLGQRSLEVAIWGQPDAATAEAALQQQLEKMIVVKN